MAYELPRLRYPYDALEPYIDTRTMEIHHQMHHGGYVNNLNKALEGHAALANQPIEQVLREIDAVPADLRQTVINHGGGHANHALFWRIMGPKKGGPPKGPLAEDLKNVFVSFDAFKNEFTKAAAGRFGSGWAWLVLDPNGRLIVTSTGNQDSPLMHGYMPVLGLDVWEHAYYLKYQNRRLEYIAAWWNVVNWDMVGEIYDAAQR